MFSDWETTVIDALRSRGSEACIFYSEERLVREEYHSGYSADEVAQLLIRMRVDLE